MNSSVHSIFFDSPSPPRLPGTLSYNNPSYDVTTDNPPTGAGNRNAAYQIESAPGGEASRPREGSSDSSDDEDDAVATETFDADQSAGSYRVQGRRLVTHQFIALIVKRFHYARLVLVLWFKVGTGYKRTKA